MTRKHSNPLPTSLRAAFEADKAHALRARLSVERLAELMAVTPALLYKWLEAETMPANRLAMWEHLTGGDNVVRYLASNAHRVVIDIPHGRPAAAADLHVLQSTLHDVVGALMAFARGELDRDRTLAQLGAGLESLAWHRENVRKSDQPELDLN